MSRLTDGRAFHALVGRFYEHESQFDSERVLTKATGRAGRADLFLWVERDHSYAVLIETKWTDWDALEGRGTRKRNLTAHRRQVWSYLDGTISVERGTRGDRVGLANVERQAGLVYPMVPKTAGLRASIEDSLGESGISVVWFDEAPPRETAAWEAWKALRIGDLKIDDLAGSGEWRRYLTGLRGISKGPANRRRATGTDTANRGTCP